MSERKDYGYFTTPWCGMPIYDLDTLKLVKKALKIVFEKDQGGCLSMSWHYCTCGTGNFNDLEESMDGWLYHRPCGGRMRYSGLHSRRAVQETNCS